MLRGGYVGGGNRICTLYIYLLIFCYACCLPSPHIPIHKGFHNSGAGAEGRRPKAASFMDGCVGAGEAAGIAKY